MPETIDIVPYLFKLFITSAKEDNVIVVVCLFVSNFAQNLRTDLHEISGKVGNGSVNK